MTTYNLKAQFQNLLRPIAHGLHERGVTPNQVTVFACILSLAYALCLMSFPDSLVFYLCFPLLFLARMALNAIDGMIAKEKNRKTKLGAILNEMGDTLSDFFLAFVFLFISNVNAHLLWGFIYMSLLAECAGAWAFSVRGERSFAGPLGKSDRGVVLTIMCYFLAWGIWRGQNVHNGLDVILVVSMILLFLTILNRLKFALRD